MTPILPVWARSAVLYEINVRQFSPEGNIKAVEHQLPRLQALGVDVLWLMPIFPIGMENRKGSLGSPYAVRDYLTVHPDLGNIHDLKSLVALAHDIGMRLILDWVPNHTAWDHVWVEAHPEFYTKIDGKMTVPLNEHGEQIHDWSDVCDLNYANPALRKAMVEAMLFWVKTCDIDGFRVDMSGLVPNDFWEEAHSKLQSMKPLFMLSEWQDEPKHFNSCFHVNYGWRFKDVTKHIAQGEADADALDALLRSLQDYYPPHYEQLYFTQNHDENAWSGSELELYGSAADIMNVLVFTWQGMPMIYNGQEDSLSQRLAFFDKDPIVWKDFERVHFFQKLTQLRRENPALATGFADNKPIRLPHNNPNIYCFYRQSGQNTVIVLLNLSSSAQWLDLQLPIGLAGEYIDHFANALVQVKSPFSTEMQPYGWLVFTKSNGR